MFRKPYILTGYQIRGYGNGKGNLYPVIGGNILHRKIIVRDFVSMFPGVLEQELNWKGEGVGESEFGV